MFTITIKTKLRVSATFCPFFLHAYDFLNEILRFREWLNMKHGLCSIPPVPHFEKVFLWFTKAQKASQKKEKQNETKQKNYQTTNNLCYHDTYIQFPIHCCKFKSSFTFFLEFYFDREINNTFSKWVAWTKVKIRFWLPITTW